MTGFHHCRLPFLLAASAGFSLAAISDVRIIGATATQAIIAYTAPDQSPCAIVVSEYGSLAPLVHDVDPTIFDGADQDTRPGNLVSGPARVAVIGKRSSELATAGPFVGVRHYSRALQAYTAHYGRILCGADTATFNFTTTNIPLGNTYGDPWLQDAAHPGEQPWPESVGGLAPESFVDPLTGVLLRRLGLRSNDYRLWNSANGPLPVFGSAYNQGQNNPCDTAGPWTNPCGTIVSGGSRSTTVGNSRAPLVLRPPLNTPGSPWPWNSGYAGNSYNQFWTLDQLSVTLTGSVNSPVKSNRVLDVCLSLNGGASCASATQQLTLDQSTGSQTVGQMNADNFGVLPWLLDTNPRFNAQESSPNASPGGSPGATASGNTLTWTAGSNYWSLYWTAGGNGRIRLSTVSTADACATPPAATSSAEYIITGFIDGLHITVSPPPPGGNLYWCENNFAVMVWRDQAPSDGSTVTLTAANMAMLESFQDAYPDNGAGTACFNKLVQDGFFCIYGGLYWINPATGASVDYGFMSLPGPGIANSWYPIGILGAGETANIDQTQSVFTFYSISFSLSTDPSGISPLVIQGVFDPASITQPPPYANGNQIGNASITGKTAYSVTYNNGLTFTNLTPQSLNQTIVQQMAAFDPSFNAVKFSTGPNSWNCLPYGDSIGIFYFTCFSLGGDSPAWIFAFSPGDGNPAHAGSASGPHIAGAINTFNTPPGPVAPNQTALTGRALHAIGETGETGWINLNLHLWPSINTSANSVPATSADCATFGHDLPSGNQCVLLNIDSHTSGGVTGYEPYFSPPRFQFTGAPGEMRTTQTGDTACVSPGQAGSCNWWDGTNELLTLVYKGPNGAWIFERNRYGAQKAIPSGPVILWWQSYQSSLPPGATVAVNVPSAMTVYWNPTAGCGGLPDPHGNCLMQDTNETIGHGEWRDGGEAVSTNVPVWIQPFWGWPTDYQTIVGGVPGILSKPFANETPAQAPGVNYTSTDPPFAGVYGHPWGFDLGTHPNPAGANASANESIRAFDNIPVQGSAYDPQFTSVAGQLYSATPAAVTDPDNIFGAGNTPAINRKLMAQGNSCGAHPLVDLSGPGSHIPSDTAASYTVCYARAGGECYPGSAAGQVYVNCPGVVWNYCSGTSIHGGTPLGVGNDICVGNQGAASDAVRQFTLDRTDQAGAYTRTLVTATSRLRMVTGFENNRLLPDNSWLLFRMEFPEYQSQQMWMAKMPPYPPTDSIGRGAFVPMVLNLQPPAGVSVDNAVVEFGYTEYSGNCTSRKDPCLANASTVGAPPFLFASENPRGVPCSSSCTIAVPAISQRVLYYQVIYRDKSDHTVAASPYQAAAVP